MIKTVFILDDEPLARTNLRKVIELYTDWTVLLERENGEGIEALVERHRPSVIFLDIRMPKRGGMSVAASLVHMECAPLIVFVSAYSEYAVQAFELYALDYLIKPFSDERFKQTVTRLNDLAENGALWRQVMVQQLEQLKTTQQPQENQQALPKSYLKVLIIRSPGVIKIVDIKDVILFRGSGNYVEVVLTKGQHLHRVSIGFLEENLDPSEFARCHRSAIVRISAISELKTIDDGQITIGLKNGATTKLSQSYRDTLLTRIEQQ